MITLRAASSAGSQGNARLDRVDFSLREKEWVAVVGPSGSGKTSLLRLIAGLEKCDQGSRELSLTVQPSGSFFLVAQANEDVLLPWRSARGNISLPLELRGKPKAAREARIESILTAISLDCKTANRLPGELSGGEKRRVAIGMALAARARVLLLDEPTSGLDVLTRDLIHRVLLQQRQSCSLTGVLVTHDLEEALLLGHQIACVVAGRVAFREATSELGSYSPVAELKQRFKRAVEASQ